VNVDSHGRSVVALGGGHGTAVTLRALRTLTDDLVAVVSVADDGGSSGRLRELLHIAALGDVRKCLEALAAPSSAFARSFGHRFSEGELAGHPIGNIVLAGLVDATGDLVGAINAAAEALGASGRVLPATIEPVTLKGFAEGREIAGQVAVSNAGQIRSVAIVPGDVASPSDALDALAGADQVVVGPGSLYTSVLAAVIPPGIREALATTRAQRVFVCNLHPQVPETEGYDVADHLRALEAHGIEIDVTLCDTSAGMPLGMHADSVVDRPLAGPNGRVHDPGRLAEALGDLLA
jgi:uncharacterized cofD-like protein